MAETAAVVFTGSSLKVKLPMTQPTGKIRIKRRSFFSEYGMPVASRSECLDLKCYIEWQIGYDLLATSANSKNTSLPRDVMSECIVASSGAPLTVASRVSMNPCLLVEYIETAKL